MYELNRFKIKNLIFLAAGKLRASCLKHRDHGNSKRKLINLIIIIVQELGRWLCRSRGEVGSSIASSVVQDLSFLLFCGLLVSEVVYCLAFSNAFRPVVPVCLISFSRGWYFQCFANIFMAFEDKVYRLLKVLDWSRSVWLLPGSSTILNVD